MREAPIEKKVTEFAKAKGWISYKWVSPNYRGVPDRLFFKASQIIIIEFKATGRKPSKLQAHIHKKLEKEGFEVHVIDSIEDGIALFA
ncbi:MAG: nuclease [Blastopirellula sp.]|nr:MAG: nuclease [Blastopirellula sp.]